MSIESRKIYEKYSKAVAYIEVKNQEDEISIGSAFHIGEGVFVTARHVIENLEITDIGIDGLRHKKLDIISGPFYHPDETIDVAVFKISDFNFPIIPLGGHYDDWIGNEFILTKAVVMGYPPIPFSNRPNLVSSSCEVNAIIDKYIGRHPHFILSSIARGGFSGGVVISEYDFALGIVIESLTTQNQPVELGYFAILTIEPIFICLEACGLMTKNLKSFGIIVMTQII